MHLRRGAICHGSYMGRAPCDGPSVLALALNDVFVPLLQKAFPEIVDFHLPPQACSYRVAVVSIRKQYAGHARRIMCRSRRTERSRVQEFRAGRRAKRAAAVREKRAQSAPSASAASTASTSRTCRCSAR